MKKENQNQSDKEPLKIIEIKKKKLFHLKKYYIFYIKKNLSKLIILLLFILNYYLYFLSLEKCFDGFDVCGEKVKWILKKLSQAVISFFILALIIELIILNKIPKYHIFHIIIVYSFFYNYSHGLDFHDHGYFNFLGCISIISVILLALLPFNGLLFFIKKNNKIYTFAYIGFLFIIFIFYLYIANSYMNCNDWPRGLNNTYIENNINIHGCIIKIPKICVYKLGKYVFDFTKWRGIKCYNNKENTKKKLLQFTEKPYINENTKRIGFPLVNIYPDLLLNFMEHNNTLLKYIKNNLVDMDNVKLVNQIYKDNKPEIIVDYTNNPHGEIIIDLQFNKTLSEERKKLEKNIDPYSKNIILLYIDSISRAYSMRQLKKTLNFIEQFMSYKGGYNKKYPLENFHSFQFFKYHSFKGYTFENYPRIFYGNRAGNNIIRITKYFKENGYITSYSNEMCLRELSITRHNMKYEEIGDHELILCDPNRKHANALVKKCLYNKLTTSHLYEYGNQFWRKYKYNRRFLIIASNDGHEGTLEILKYLDNTIFNFLNDLFNNNLFKDTTIFLLSDHGTAMPSPYYMTQFFQTERFLPMLYIICNDIKRISYNKQYQYIYKNQQILITGYDIYNTLAHLLYGDSYEFIANKTDLQDTPKSKYGISLFKEIKSKDRTPINYNNDNNTMILDVCI